MLCILNALLDGKDRVEELESVDHQSKINFDHGHKKTPLGRSSLPEDIASAVIWLEANPAITGIDLIVDGGQHLAPSNRDVMFTV